MADKYMILYVDEEEYKRNQFQRNTEEHFIVNAIHPPTEINDLTQLLFFDQYDALITDYRLSEKDSTIPYSGVDLVDQVQNIRQSFPCFVLTDYDDEAVSQAEDVNVVYPRSDLNEESNSSKRAPLYHKIKTQITHYKKRLSEAEHELLALIDKGRSAALNVAEESRLIELDTLLSSETNKQADIPMQLKDPKNLSKIQELIDVSNKLIGEIHAKNKSK